MTQTHTPTPSLAWRQALQLKLMAALDAAWAILEHSDDPAEIRQVREKLRSIGDLAAMARKVGLIMPTPRVAPVAAGGAETSPALAPVAAQAEHTRRALDKLKGGGRARL